MAYIAYKPCCSNCGAAIEDEVMYQRIQLHYDSVYSIGSISDWMSFVHPSRCSSCGAVFDHIEIKPPKEVKE